MNAKEFLQMEKQVEQLMAFQSMMKGELAKETKEAKEALKALGEAKDLAKARKELEEAKVLFEKDKEIASTQAQEANQKLEAKGASLALLSDNLARKKQELADTEAKVNALVYDLNKAKYEFTEYKQKELDALATTRAELQVRLDKFQIRVDEVAAREAAVEKKLAILREV